MELLETVIIALQLTNILAKRYKGLSSSEESIENILYFKDCNHKPKSPEPAALRELAPPPPPIQQECKMCCTMCCGDNCHRDCDNGQASGTRQAPSMTNERGLVRPMSKPTPREPDSPSRSPLRGRKKKLKEPLLPPIGSRREFGFTRENIKTLIAQDEDIKKILKDLVKVTMQKVDLVEMINARRNEVDESENLVDNSENVEES